MKISRPNNDAERKLCIILNTSTKACKELLPIIKKEYFTNQHTKILFSWIKKYFEEFNRAPNKDIQDIYKNNKSDVEDEETVDLLKKFLSSISKEYTESEPENIDFQISESMKFLKLRSLEILKNSIQDSIDEKNPDKGESAISKHESIIDSNSTSLFSRIGDLEIKSPEWIIDGLFEKDSTSILFGDPGTGKSFIALDIGASVASGTDFHTQGTSLQGPVIYVCGEGRNTIARRCRAWSIKNECNLNNQPFFILNTPIQLLDDKSLIPLKQSLINIADQEGDPILIIIDTWNRLSGGDENSNSDAAKAIAALDKLRAPYGCSVLIVHHSGHSEKQRARGASALNGAVDNSFKVERKNTESEIIMTNTKCKDGKPSKPMAFDLIDVDLGIKDEHGRSIESAALSMVDYVKPEKAQNHIFRGKVQQSLDILKTLIEDTDNKVTTNIWKERCINEGIKECTFWKHRRTLIDTDEIQFNPSTGYYNYNPLRGVIGSYSNTSKDKGTISYSKLKQTYSKVIVMESSLKRQLKHSYKNINKGA